MHPGPRPGNAGPLEPRHAEQQVLFRRQGAYAAFPLLERTADGRLAAAWLMNDAGVRDHYGLYEWRGQISADDRGTWTAAEGVGPGLPFPWAGSSPRERYDRYAGAAADGRLMVAGAVGWEVWPAQRAAEAAAAGRRWAPHPSGDPAQIVVAGHKLFTQCSSDGARTWRRREWTL